MLPTFRSMSERIRRGLSLSGASPGTGGNTCTLFFLLGVGNWGERRTSSRLIPHALNLGTREVFVPIMCLK